MFIIFYNYLLFYTIIVIFIFIIFFITIINIIVIISIYHHCIISVFMVTLHFASCCLLACLLAHAHARLDATPTRTSGSNPSPVPSSSQFAKNWTERRKKETLRQPAFCFLSCSSFHEQTPMSKQEGQRPV